MELISYHHPIGAMVVLAARSEDKLTLLADSLGRSRCVYMYI
jgi:hypothetical protein